ncbi:hypothetical protein Q5P01_017875 [Channa striata]|uniref:Uncharacterized protein n=1 Tax=Channa striata TaxID=64152 RepID=A0AA88SFA6_CHASR|nr:hypothetical protein Q5P01_017875 [Channa striata]
MGHVHSTRFVHRVARGTWDLVDFVLSCAVSFFTTLYMHPMEQQRCMALIRKREEAEVDAAINTVARSITGLDANIAMLKEFAASDTCERAAYAKYVNELRNLLAALRGQIDTDKLISAVDTLSDNVGLQLDASVKINRTVLALTVNRDLDDAREPVTKSTVETACLTYQDETASALTRGALARKRSTWVRRRILL